MLKNPCLHTGRASGPWNASLLENKEEEENPSSGMPIIYSRQARLCVLRHQIKRTRSIPVVLTAACSWGFLCLPPQDTLSRSVLMNHCAVQLAIFWGIELPVMPLHGSKVWPKIFHTLVQRAACSVHIARSAVFCSETWEAVSQFKPDPLGGWAEGKRTLVTQCLQKRSLFTYPRLAKCLYCYCWIQKKKESAKDDVGSHF